MEAQLACAAALLAVATASAAEEVPLPRSWAMLAVDDALPAPRPPGLETAASIEGSKSYVIPAAEIIGFDLLLNQFDRHVIGEPYHTSLASIRHNLRSSWVVDSDPFVVNQLGHPYQGSMYHGFARASGLGYWEASAYTFLGSAFWEIAGETSPPSRNDQVASGIGGSFLGEALFRMSNLVLEHDGLPPFWRELAATAISPPVGFNRLAFGDRFANVFPSRDPVYFTRLQVGFSGTAGDEATGVSTTKLEKNEFLTDFFIDYGLPGKADYEYTRPFDYFSFQATASSANGFENVMTRGLLWGRSYGADVRYRGIWGVYGNYDYIAPQTYRISTTGVSLGTTGEWRVGHGMALQGTVLAGTGYAAAGTVRSSDVNDFHYGVAPQALVALRWIFGTRAAIDITAREYYVSRLAAAARGGHENIGRADAAFTWRIHGPHAISIKYLGNRRDSSYPDIGGMRQQRQTLGLFYTYLGHDRFGEIDWR